MGEAPFRILQFQAVPYQHGRITLSFTIQTGRPFSPFEEVYITNRHGHMYTPLLTPSFQRSQGERLRICFRVWPDEAPFVLRWEGQPLGRVYRRGEQWVWLPRPDHSVEVQHAP